MRRPWVRIPSRPPSFNDLERAKQSYRGTLGLSSLPVSFRYLVIHPERHCLSAAASVNTSPLLIPPWELDSLRLAEQFVRNFPGAKRHFYVQPVTCRFDLKSLLN